MFLDQYPDVPFRVLRFLVTEINYGGRVTDDKDRRLMSNLINNFLGPEVLDPNYTFSASGRPARLKPATSFDTYIVVLAVCRYDNPYQLQWHAQRREVSW